MNWFQRRLTPLRAVLIYALEPVFAAFIGWLVFREGISGRETAGALLILLGILVSDLWRYLPFRKTPPRPRAQC
jgi:drug/metabolite transporter (DMT)-like permease